MHERSPCSAPFRASGGSSDGALRGKSVRLTANFPCHFDQQSYRSFIRLCELKTARGGATSINCTRSESASVGQASAAKIIHELAEVFLRCEDLCFVAGFRSAVVSDDAAIVSKRLQQIASVAFTSVTHRSTPAAEMGLSQPTPPC